MAEQLTDTALRELIAQWVRAALGELVSDDGIEDEGEQSPVAPLQTFSDRVEEEEPTKGLAALK
jgi:hypothetical protein